MTKQKRDLVLHYDEERNVVICYSTEENRTREIREKGFPLEVAVSVYKGVSSDEAERMMGAGIFALLDLHSEVPIGIRNYQELSETSVAEMRGELEAAAQLGDGEAQYSLGMELFSEGVLHHSEEQIHQAEVWLRKSAGQGNPDAIAYLNDHWERSKASALRGISKSSGEADD